MLLSPFRARRANGSLVTVSADGYASRVSSCVPTSSGLVWWRCSHSTLAFVVGSDPNVHRLARLNVPLGRTSRLIHTWVPSSLGSLQQAANSTPQPTSETRCIGVFALRIGPLRYTLYAGACDRYVGFVRFSVLWPNLLKILFHRNVPVSL